MKYLKIIITLLFFINYSSAIAQENGNGKTENSLSEQRKIQKKARFAVKERHRKEKAERKAVKKHHKRIQTKEVQKRMKKNRARANLHNENRREPFFKRLFKKKK